MVITESYTLYLYLRMLCTLKQVIMIPEPLPTIAGKIQGPNRKVKKKV